MLTNKKVLITGASSGLGKALAQRLVINQNQVWGVSRRTGVNLQDNIYYSTCDLTEKYAWKRIVSDLKRKKFVPEIVIFNAAIFGVDFVKDINSQLTEKLVETNFLSVVRGLGLLLPLLKKNSQVVAISSSSALKGSGEEGIGYAASKAALSIAFESLYLRYGKKIKFKTIFFGPIKTGMNPFNKFQPGTLSEKTAVDKIIKSLENNGIAFYYPWPIFLVLRLIRLFPSSIYFGLLKILDKKLHRKFVKMR